MGQAKCQIYAQHSPQRANQTGQHLAQLCLDRPWAGTPLTTGLDSSSSLHFPSIPALTPESPPRHRPTSMEQRRRARSTTVPVPFPLLLLLLLLLGPVTTAAATAASPDDGGGCDRPWLEAAARHGRLAARACPASGAIEMTLTSSREEEARRLAIPLAAVGFRYRGRWLSANRGGGLVLAGVEVSEEEGVDVEEGDGVSTTPASASAALGPSTLLSVQWRAEVVAEEGKEASRVCCLCYGHRHARQGKARHRGD